jgi:two-component system nitrogen regulation sensor histidine kinase NtrY
MTRRLGEGDLAARVSAEALRGNDEIKQLAETFNEMAERLGEQQADLKDTHADLDERNRFTEAVLDGVSSGVIGVDENGFINHANEVAGALYEQPAEALIGQSLNSAMPEFSGILAALNITPARRVTREFNINNPALNGRIIRAAAQMTHGVHGGAIITFDDITDLLTAQRNAAWSDIARRIAHEIKNPLTPIQLSAERLQARYGKGANDEKDIFKQCTDTIIRQVEDIGNMVDEFASFARMPTARMEEVNLADIISEAVLLQRVAHRDISYSVSDVPDVNLVGDRRLISQALTNILKNAEEAVRLADNEKRISVTVEESDGQVVLSVSDSGVGWPEKNRYDLLEPYNTSREEGTGLGLSIVKKIVDDHGGKLVLSDAPWCASGGSGAMLQVVLPLQSPEMVGKSKMLEEI